MSSQPRAIVVFGSGPGVGRSVAAEFASQGFEHIILLSRNAQRLEEDKAIVTVAARKANIQIYTATVDLESKESLQKAFAFVDNLGFEIEVVVFNGARVAPSLLFETSPEQVESDFKTTTIGLYLVAEWALPKLQAITKSSPQAKPSLIVTSGFLHKDPEPTFFSLSLVKTAQRNLVQSLSKTYGPKGIHVGLVLIGGYILPTSKVLTPPNIAKVTWDFYNQEPAKWTLEVEMVEE